MNDLFETLATRAQQHPDQVALIGESGNLTYRQVGDHVNMLSAWLSENGIGRAGLWGDNSIEWIIADLAAWKAGVTLIEN